MVIVVVVVDVGGQEGGGCCWDNYCGGSYDGCDCLWPKKKQGKFKYKRVYFSLAQISATCTAPIIYNSGTTTLSCEICWTSRHCRHVAESVTNAQL